MSIQQLLDKTRKWIHDHLAGGGQGKGGDAPSPTPAPPDPSPAPVPTPKPTPGPVPPVPVAGQQDTVLFIRDDPAYLSGGNQGRNSMLDLLTMPISTPGQKDAQNAEREAKTGAIKAINPGASWVPMWFFNDGAEVASPYEGAHTGSLLGNGKFRYEVTSFWCAVWWNESHAGLKPSMVLSCGDSPTRFNDPDSADWQHMVNDFGYWYRTSMNVKYPGCLHSVVCQWEAEKIVGSNVKKLQDAVTFTRNAFQGTAPVAVHLTQPALLHGLDVDLVMTQSPWHPFHADEHSTDEVLRAAQAFRDQTTAPIIAVEWADPYAQTGPAKREALRKSGLVQGVGW